MPDFNAFTIKYNGTADRLITELNLTPVFDPLNPPMPPPPLVPTSALWDTGATKSVITPSIAKALGVAPVGTVLMNHAQGASQCNTYLVNLYLPNRVLIPGILVSECQDTAHFGAIVGMDIIGQGDLSITNVNGETCFSFRIPSIAEIDYATEANKIRTTLTSARIGRNQPCPCGSGEKYKRCHGA